LVEHPAVEGIGKMCINTHNEPMSATKFEETGMFPVQKKFVRISETPGAGTQFFNQKIILNFYFLTPIEYKYL